MEIHNILKGYLDEEGKFDRLPGKRQKKKLDSMIQFLAAQFESGKNYSELEVNEILNQHHNFNDPATLRRLLFGSRKLNRTVDGRSYWLIEENENVDTTDQQTPKQIAQHLRAVYFGGNWTSTNLKDTLAGVTWQQATTQIYDLNTIATLVYHATYYVFEVSKVLEGQPLTAKDKYSFEHPPIASQEDWEQLLAKVWVDVEHFASLIEQLPSDQLWADFVGKKYGNYYRNLHGIIEHLHYHLGQIVLIKKILVQHSEASSDVVNPT